MTKKLNLKKNIYFFDDRNKYDHMYKMKKVLYVDKDSCLCIAKATVPGIPDEKILFHLKTKEVDSREFWSWLATDDKQWAEEEIAEQKERSEK